VCEAEVKELALELDEAGGHLRERLPPLLDAAMSSMAVHSLLAT
jgi:hypothetical protein